ncbi:MAG: hydrogenase maturation nickel metallochaperone HypA [Clostridia bacterium]|nr:hydrogenase maturation nickel metallochaperone HypA [Clostridia bacterium]
MHEYAVTKSLVNIVEEEAKKAGAGKVTEIKLVIGDLSTIIDESVQMYFDIISEGTVAQGARLIFRRVPAEFQCKSCGCVYNKPEKGFECPGCGSVGIPTGKGKEFYIESLEVE